MLSVGDFLAMSSGFGAFDCDSSTATLSDFRTWRFGRDCFLRDRHWGGNDWVVGDAVGFSNGGIRDIDSRRGVGGVGVADRVRYLWKRMGLPLSEESRMSSHVCDFHHPDCDSHGSSQSPPQQWATQS